MSGRAANLRRWPAVAATVLVVGGAAGWYAIAAGSGQSPTATAQASTGSASVNRGTVTQRLPISGTLGYAAAYQVVHQGPPGVVTATAQPGVPVNRGSALYAVANIQTRLLYGTTPAYRDFASGIVDGPDVRELEDNLVALGMDPQRAIAVDDHFSAATAAAIRRWQASWGLPAARRTGTLPVGQVVFLPGAARVTTVEVAPGRAVGPNEPVLGATSPDRVVTAQLAVERQSVVRVADAVTVTIAGIPPFPGTVALIGAVATAAPSANGATSSSANRAAPLTMSLTITVTLPETARGLDQAPAQVLIAGETHKDVLMVPLISLLANPGGGYRVRLTSGQFVDVQLGLSDDSTGSVEVQGDLTAGQQVEVPAT